MTASEALLPGEPVAVRSVPDPAEYQGFRRVIAFTARVIAAVSTAGMALAGAGIAVMLVYVCWYVLGRYFHFWAPPSASQVAGYLMAFCFFLGLAYVFRVGGFILMAPLKRIVPSRAVPWIESVLLLITLGYVGILAWFALDSVLEAIRFGTKTFGVVEIPLWIPQMAMPVGLTVWFLQVLSLLLERIFLGRPAPSGELAEA